MINYPDSSVIVAAGSAGADEVAVIGLERVQLLSLHLLNDIYSSPASISILNSGFLDYSNLDYKIILFLDPQLFKKSTYKRISDISTAKLFGNRVTDMGRYLSTFKTTAIDGEYLKQEGSKAH